VIGGQGSKYLFIEGARSPTLFQIRDGDPNTLDLVAQVCRFAR
jgi:hypothetical protein